MCVHMRKSEAVLDPWGAHTCSGDKEWGLADWEFVLGYACKLESPAFFFFFSRREEEDLVTEGGRRKGRSKLSQVPGLVMSGEVPAWGQVLLRGRGGSESSLAIGPAEGRERDPRLAACILDDWFCW